MTDHLTLGDVLFEQPEPASYDVVRRLATSPGAPVRLRQLARARRYVTETELATQMAAILRRGLSDLVVSAWASFDAVQEAATKSRRHSDDPVFVAVVNHRASRSFAPRLDVFIDETLLARFVLQARVELVLSGVILKLVGGRIVAVAAGTWTGTGSLSCNGTELATRTTGARALPGVIDLGEGVALGGAAAATPLVLVVEPAPGLGPATIATGQPVVIGRHPSCTAIVAADPDVAPHHAVFYRLGDLLVVEDLGSATGTWLNGSRLTALAVVRDGDEIGVGRYRIRVTCQRVPGGDTEAGSAPLVEAPPRMLRSV